MKVILKGLKLPKTVGGSFDLLHCFPDQIQPSAFEVVSLATRDEPVNARLFATFVIGNEMLAYPSRLYMQSRQLNDAVIEWNDERRQVALCLGTRHHDGFLRESCLRRLGVPDVEWKIPFVALLLGDYVVEISSLAASTLASAPRSMVAAFAANNADAFCTLKRRAISYWDCYHRNLYATYKMVPAVSYLDELDHANQAS